MILNTTEITPEIKKRAIEIGEEIFATQSAPDQMQVSEENFEKLKALNPNTILYEVIDNEPVGWVVLVPTSTEIMDKFLSGVIGEQKILDLAEKQEHYPALYLCAAAVLPAYRRQGLAVRLLKEAVSRMPLQDGYQMYAWPTSEEGKALLEKFQKETGKVIPIRQ